MSVMAAALAIVAGTSHSGNTHVSTKNRRAWIEPSDRRGVAYKLFRDWGKKQPINGAKECARRVRQMAAGQI